MSVKSWFLDSLESTCRPSLCYLIRPLWLYTACTAAKKTELCLFSLPSPPTNNCANTQVTMYNSQIEQRRVTLMFIACRPVPPSSERDTAMLCKVKRSKRKTQANKCLATINKWGRGDIHTETKKEINWEYMERFTAAVASRTHL